MPPKTLTVKLVEPPAATVEFGWVVTVAVQLAKVPTVIGVVMLKGALPVLLIVNVNVLLKPAVRLDSVTEPPSATDVVPRMTSISGAVTPVPLTVQL